MITLEQAKALHYRSELHHVSYTNADGTPVRCRVNGEIRTWKTWPMNVRRWRAWLAKGGPENESLIAEIDRMKGRHWKLPVKRGMYECFYIGTTDDCQRPEDWTLRP